MMELQCGNVSVVSAQDAAAAGLGYQDLLDAPAAARNPIGTALGAPVVAVGAEDESRAAMDFAVQMALNDSGRPCLASTNDRDGWPRLQVPPP